MTEAERIQEKKADKENAALKQLQGLSGLMSKKPSGPERLDWMYEQSVAQKTEDELMNIKVSGEADKDIEKVNALKTTSGSLFLRDTKRTTEDTLRKLREDPLFQIRQEEHAARESLMANPLVMARVKAKQAKSSKKEKKQAKKAKKKAKKLAKKEKKAAKKAGKGSSSSSSSSSASSAPEPPIAAPKNEVKADNNRRPRSPDRRENSRDARRRRDAGSSGRDGRDARRGGDNARSRSRSRGRDRKESRRDRSGDRRSPEKKVIRKVADQDLTHLGPQTSVLSARDDFFKKREERKDAALSSRGAPRRMDEEEKSRRYEEMRNDGRSHEASKDARIEANTDREKQMKDLEDKARLKGTDKKMFKEMRNDAYMGSDGSLADRLQTQRGRRQAGIVDSLEKD